MLGTRSPGSVGVYMVSAETPSVLMVPEPPDTLRFTQFG